MEVTNGFKGDLQWWMETENSRAPVSKVENLLNILWLYISDLQHNHALVHSLVLSAFVSSFETILLFFFSFYIKHQKKCPTLVLILLYVNCTSDRGDQLATFSTKNFASVVPGSPERVKKAGTFLGTKTMSEQLNIDR